MRLGVLSNSMAEVFSEQIVAYQSDCREHSYDEEQSIEIRTTHVWMDV